MTAQESPFVARINLPNEKTPIRAYVHKAGQGEVFVDPVKAINYFKQELASGLKCSLEDYDFVLATIWGEESPGKSYENQKRNIDIFGFGYTENWPGNPDVSTLAVRNGICEPNYDPNKDFGSVLTCGDTLIMLGREEEYRRVRPTLQSYLHLPPNLGTFEPPINRFS
jgi:hypothetical protein|tara:strand:- start:1531 stop:2034 length:504 start_codon:yes stop_codon:yes gene_type:complete